jgi:hypothetical protein
LITRPVKKSRSNVRKTRNGISNRQTRVARFLYRVHGLRALPLAMVVGSSPGGGFFPLGTGRKTLRDILKLFRSKSWHSYILWLSDQTPVSGRQAVRRQGLCRNRCEAKRLVMKSTKLEWIPLSLCWMIKINKLDIKELNEAYEGKSTASRLCPQRRPNPGRLTNISRA